MAKQLYYAHIPYKHSASTYYLHQSSRSVRPSACPLPPASLSVAFPGSVRVPRPVLCPGRTRDAGLGARAQPPWPGRGGTAITSARLICKTVASSVRECADHFPEAPRPMYHSSLIN